MHKSTAAMNLPKAPRRHVGILALPALVITVLLMAGCSVGSYPVDYFPEMHYGQNYRIQEVPRLDKPQAAIVFQGAGVENLMTVVNNYDSTAFADITTVSNPFGSNPESLARGQEVYRINCAGCHGVDGAGTSPSGGFVLPALLIGGSVTGPVDFAGDEPDSIAMSRTAGELYWIITCGTETLWEPHAKSLVTRVNTPDYCTTGQAPLAHPNPDFPRGNMPAFASFLSPDDRWAAVQVLQDMRTR